MFKHNDVSIESSLLVHVLLLLRLLLLLCFFSCNAKGRKRDHQSVLYNCSLREARVRLSLGETKTRRLGDLVIQDNGLSDVDRLVFPVVRTAQRH